MSSAMITVGSISMRFLVVLLCILISTNSYACKHDDKPHCDPRKDKNCHHHHGNNHNHHDSHNHYSSLGSADGEALLIVSSLVSITISILFTTEYYNKKDKKDKRIIKAQSDVATYIVSDGKFDSVYLEQAFLLLREQYPNISDMALVKAIITF